MKRRQARFCTNRSTYLPAEKPVRLMVRGYGGRALIFTERIVVEAADLERVAERHLNRLANYPKNMVEIEFLDEPDVNQRFFRFGTDPGRMVIPIELDLTKFKP